MTKWFRLSLIVLTVALAACNPPEEKPEAPNGPEAPPPPTPQEIAQSIITELNLDMPSSATGGKVSEGMYLQLMASIREKHSIHSGTPDGKEALEHVKGRIEKRIRDFSNENAWQHVIVYIDMHKVLDPSSKKYLSLEEEAEQQLKKPILTLRGMPVLNGRRVILINFEFPDQKNLKKQEQVSIGDELHGIRVVDVFGNNRGITVEYLETGERDVIFLKNRS